MSVQILQSLIQSVPNFPKPGILFRDITPLLADPKGLRLTAKLMADRIENLPHRPTLIAGPESRGFIFGVGLAKYLSIGFIPIRKQGKLPRAVYKCQYELEYGFDTLEVHQDAFNKEDQVLLVDDLLATGGTASACVELVNKAGANVLGSIFVIELLGLNGRAKMPKDIAVESLIQYD
ncbi:adenine phosphoribosyltransferase [Fastidiosibacter lacustris]|uniref:adenine phosphoribosyltransferase n=1 Tax=Fastidiosibacter lacustris TaxID=2056695 RepID=UPI000E350E32|nr:adenine phosphoribosyltransferase [Fastidiosibacter lacustris]